MKVLPMNVFLWVLQVALALLYLAGGSYKVFKFDELAKMPQTGALSRSAWGALGMFEMLGAVLLVVPAATKWMPALTAIAAAALALESLALAGLFARHSLKLTAHNPLVWTIVMGLLAAFVAYGRYALLPGA
jgi:DoxX-like family